MFFFKRKPNPLKSNPPLMNAIHMVISATQIAQIYQHDRKYMPSGQELLLFELLTEALSRNHAKVEHITLNLHRRTRGEPEDLEKFTDPI